MKHKATIMLWANPDWIRKKTMAIPAFAANTTYSFAYDPTPYMGLMTNGVIASGWNAGHVGYDSPTYSNERMPFGPDQHTAIFPINVISKNYGAAAVPANSYIAWHGGYSDGVWDGFDSGAYKAMALTCVPPYMGPRCASDNLASHTDGNIRPHLFRLRKRHLYVSV